MPLAVLGSYELSTCLSKHAYAHVYLAADANDNRYIVKFLTNPDVFFEELARHYAVDDCAHVCKLVHNFPSYAVSGDPFMFRRSLAALFDLEPFGRHSPSPEEMVVSPLADVGVLVLEYVEGTPLVELLPHLSPEQRLAHLSNLAGAVLQLHECGECHGDLIAPNVLLADQEPSMRLLDLGYFPNKPLPEGQRRAPKQGLADEEPLPADDVYMLAYNFMRPIAEAGSPLADLAHRCMAEEADHRPSMEQVTRTLKQLCGEDLPAAAVVRRPAPFKWAALVAVMILGFVSWTAWRAGSAGASAVRLPEGRPMALTDASERQLRHTSLASARVDTSAVPLPAPANDFYKPVAVFAHPDAPVLVGADSIYHLGDRVRLPEGDGVVFSIGLGEVLVMTDHGLRAFDLVQPGYHPQSDQQTGWLVWRHEGNLPRLLTAAAQLLDGWDDIGSYSAHQDLNFLLRRHPDDMEVVDDSVYGFYPATGAKHFVVLLAQQLDVQPDGTAWRVGLREDLPPLFLTFSKFMVEDVTVKGFSKHLGEYTGLTVSYPPDLEDVVLPRRVFTDIPWQDVLDALGFDWSLMERENETVVEIRAMNI